METIYVNPERRDPGFREGKHEIGLGNVDNISTSDLMSVVIDSAYKVSNEKKKGKKISASGESFYPLFESATESSTCSLEVGFLREGKECASFEFSFSFFYSDDGTQFSYSLNVAPDAYPISSYYLRIYLDPETKALIGGVYCDRTFRPDSKFDQVAVNLVHWTTGSTILDPSYNAVSYVIPYELIANIPLRSSSSTLGHAADSVVVYDQQGLPQGVKDSYVSSEFIDNLDAPSINGVPFLIKRFVTIDNKPAGRHITVTAYHDGPHLKEAGEHNWDVLSRIRKAGLIETNEGAEPANGQMLNDDSFGFGVTRLSQYGLLDPTQVSLENLAAWMKTLGLDTDVISAGLFRNFVGYLINIINPSSNHIIYDFSLNESSEEFIFADHTGSEEGQLIIFNSYKRKFNNGTYSDERVVGSSSLISWTKEDPEGIINDVTFSIDNTDPGLSTLGDYQIGASVKINRNEEEKVKHAYLYFTQKEGNNLTGQKTITIYIEQLGFEIKYGIGMLDTDPITLKYKDDVILIEKDNNSFTEVLNIIPVRTENTEIGYRNVSSETSMSFIYEDASRSWVDWSLKENEENPGTYIFTVVGEENTRPSKRLTSGFILIYDLYEQVVGQISVIITQQPVVGTLEITSGNTLNADKNGGTQSITVYSNYPWTILPNTIPSWISFPDFNGSRGSGTSKVAIKIEENQDYSLLDRSAEIKFINDYGNEETLVVNQSGKDGYFYIKGFPDSDAYISMGTMYGRDKITVRFFTDRNWMIDYKPEWIKLSHSSGPSVAYYRGIYGGHLAWNEWEIEMTYDPSKNTNNSLGDYVSFGYFDENTKSIYSLRKIYIDLGTWTKTSDNLSVLTNDTELGAYLYGPLFTALKPGETTNIYCVSARIDVLPYYDAAIISDMEWKETVTAAASRPIGFIDDEEGGSFGNPHQEYYSVIDNLNLPEEISAEAYTWLTAINFNLELSSEFEFVDNKWIEMTEEERQAIGLDFPEVNNYDKFRLYKKTIKATDHFDPSHEFYTLESSDVVEDLNLVPDQAIKKSHNLILTPKILKLLPSGLKVKAIVGGEESGSETGVTIRSGRKQIIQLEISPKETGQPFLNPFLLNSSLPGWLYFNEALTNLETMEDPITLQEEGINSFSYDLTLLPNRTGKRRTVTLQLTDRGIKSTQVNFTINQNSIGYDASRRIISVIPILKRKITDHKAVEIEIKPLITYSETYSIDGGETKIRTYREIPEYRGSAQYRCSETWMSVKTKGSSQYLNLLENYDGENDPATPREGTIYVTVLDGSREITGSLKIYQPSSSTKVTTTVSDLSVELYDLGKEDNKLPLELYSIGYKIKGKRKVKFGSETIYEDNVVTELFPDSIEDLKVITTGYQTYSSDIPLTLVRVDPSGVENDTNVKAILYGTQVDFRVYQDMTDLPFECEYSYLQVDSDNIDFDFKVNLGEVNIERGLYKVGNTTTTDSTFLSIPNISISSQNKIIRSGNFKIIPGETDREYLGYTGMGKGTGLSVQRRLASGPIKFNGYGNEFILTVVPKMNIDGYLYMDKTHEKELMDSFSEYPIKHSGTLPYVFFVSGSLRYLDGVVEGTKFYRYEFGNIFGSIGGDDIVYEYELEPGFKNEYEHLVSVTNLYSDFFCPHYPVYSWIHDLERTGKSDRLNFRISKHSNAYNRSYGIEDNPQRGFRFKGGVTIMDITGDTHECDEEGNILGLENHHEIKRLYINRENIDKVITIDYSGMPLGVRVREVKFNESLQIPSRYLSFPQYFHYANLDERYYELVVRNTYKQEKTDLHGVYRDYDNVGDIISIKQQWGQNITGNNPGQRLIEEGIDFKIMTITFEFKIINEDGTETVFNKDLEVYVKGRNSGTQITSAAKKLLIRKYYNPNYNSEYVTYSYWGSDGNYKIMPVNFYTDAPYWMFYMVNSIEEFSDGQRFVGSDVIFNNLPYSTTYTGSGNSGYNSRPMERSMGLDLNTYNSDNPSDTGRNSGTDYFQITENHRSIRQEDDEFITDIVALGSSSLENVDWEYLSRQSSDDFGKISLYVGPPTPWLLNFRCWYRNKWISIPARGEMIFSLIPIVYDSSTQMTEYVLCASFNMDFPYKPERGSLDVARLISIPEFYGTGTAFTVGGNHKKMDPISEWDKKFIAIPQTNTNYNFFVILRSKNYDTGDRKILLDTVEDSDKIFGYISFKMKDPVTTDDNLSYKVSFQCKYERYNYNQGFPNEIKPWVDDDENDGSKPGEVLEDTPGEEPAEQENPDDILPDFPDEEITGGIMEFVIVNENNPDWIPNNGYHIISPPENIAVFALSPNMNPYTSQSYTLSMSFLILTEFEFASVEEFIRNFHIKRFEGNSLIFKEQGSLFDPIHTWDMDVIYTPTGTIKFCVISIILRSLSTSYSNTGSSYSEGCEYNWNWYAHHQSDKTYYKSIKLSSDAVTDRKFGELTVSITDPDNALISVESTYNCTFKEMRPSKYIADTWIPYGTGNGVLYKQIDGGQSKTF